MYKITDITSLGAEYTVSSPDGKVLGAVQIIPFVDILAATIGPYAESFGTYENYMQGCVKLLSGFDKIDQNSVLWYATTEEEVALSNVIEYAINNGYSTIILEYLEELE
jgi:hypothetical protein